MLAGGLLLSACSIGTPMSDEGPVTDVHVHDEDGLNGAVLPTPYTASDVALRDTDGSKQALDTLTADAGDDLTLVFFGYTHCPDICQIVMADIASALTRLDDEQRERVGMTFVTTDPARDDEETLRAQVTACLVEPATILPRPLGLPAAGPAATSAPAAKAG